MCFCKASIFSFFTLFLFAGCEISQKNGLIGEWYINPYHAEYELEAINAHLILRLYPKGVFTQYGETGYCAGTWKRNEKGNYLHLVRKSGNLPLLHEFLNIESFEAEKLIVGVFYKMPFRIADRKMIVQLTRQKNKSDEDPYKPELQLWRLKPNIAASETEIRKRVEGYLHFLYSMYQHAIDNNGMQKGNKWYPLPLRLDHSRGVRMAYEDELKSWNNAFMIRHRL